MVCTGIDDILTALKINKTDIKEKNYNSCSEDEKTVISCFKRGLQSCIDIIAETKYSTGELAQILTSLEMKGIIYNISNDQWALA